MAALFVEEEENPYFEIHYFFCLSLWQRRQSKWGKNYIIGSLWKMTDSPSKVEHYKHYMVVKESWVHLNIFINYMFSFQ